MFHACTHPRVRTTRGARGFGLLETMITIGITAAISFAVATLQTDVIKIDRIMQNSFSAQQEARKAFKTMTPDIRVMAWSASGAYPLLEAADNSMTFYSDPEGDGTVQRIRYFLSGTTLKKGVIQPTGVPAVYNTASETITDIVYNVANGATPIFAYYDWTYDGTSAALTQPVSTPKVRLVKITITIDRDGGRPPGPQTYSTQVMFRNLKDNL